jgi:hypothetical protein
MPSFTTLRSWCRFRFQSGTGGVREIKALREMSPAAFSVLIETGSTFFPFQLGLVDRLIDRTMGACRVCRSNNQAASYAPLTQFAPEPPSRGATPSRGHCSTPDHSEIALQRLHAEESTSSKLSRPARLTRHFSSSGKSRSQGGNVGSRSRRTVCRAPRR